MAAIHATLVAAELGPGDTVVAGRDLYGATQTLPTTLFGANGVRVRLEDATDSGRFGALIAAARPKVVYVETIGNPLLRLPDLDAIGAAARAAGATFVVDNTFASPYLCRPAENGAQAVIHSATKYLGGHGDLTAGVVAAEEALLDRLRTVARLAGATLGAFDAWLALRGVRTLALRLERQCANALDVAQHLAGHPRVERVHYPGLPDHPQHALARRLFGGRGYGGMVAFELRGAGAAEVARFMDALRLVLPAPTMGDVYSLALHPAQASHRGLTPEQRAALGIRDSLVRLSVGIEDAGDIIADLDQALAQAGGSGR
jgi:cystathionine gamma-synthase/methionine-gamma-lyase